MNMIKVSDRLYFSQLVINDCAEKKLRKKSFSVAKKQPSTLKVCFDLWQFL